MVLRRRLELPPLAGLAPQASASAIPPSEHVIKIISFKQCLMYTIFFKLQVKNEKNIKNLFPELQKSYL